MFRNRRAAVGGFPRRSLECTGTRRRHARRRRSASTAGEFPPTCSSRRPLWRWTTQTIRACPGCCSCSSARAGQVLSGLPQPGESAGPGRSAAHAQRRQAGAFPRRPELVQRDRNAAYFAQKRRRAPAAVLGDRLGRPQFPVRAPADPVGPAARSGSARTTHRPARPHRPAPRYRASTASRSTGSAQHVLVRWYDEGLDAFRSSPADGRELCKPLRRARWCNSADRARARRAKIPTRKSMLLIAETRARTPRAARR